MPLLAANPSLCLDQATEALESYEIATSPKAAPCPSVFSEDVWRLTVAREESRSLFDLLESEDKTAQEEAVKRKAAEEEEAATRRKAEEAAKRKEKPMKKKSFEDSLWERAMGAGFNLDLKC